VRGDGAALVWSKLDYIHGLSLSCDEKGVLITLAKFESRKRGHSFASQSTIARDAGLSRHGVMRLLRKLEQRGFIRTEERKGRTALIVLDWVKIRTCSRQLHVAGGDMSQRGTPRVAGGDRGCSHQLHEGLKDLIGIGKRGGDRAVRERTHRLRDLRDSRDQTRRVLKTVQNPEERERLQKAATDLDQQIERIEAENVS